MKRILVTGSTGQIGVELLPTLMNKYGKENVIATARRKMPEAFKKMDVHYKRLDVLDMEHLLNMLVDYDIDIIIHNASVLSAVGERNPQLAHDINFKGFFNVLEATKQLNLEQLNAPSSIAAFGPSTPKENTPNDVIMRPTTIYGISKVYIELMGEYYASKFGVDFRSLRYPGVISSEAEPGGGTTDYAIWIFYEALKAKKYTSFLDANTYLPMMYMPDCLKCTIDLIDAPQDKLIHRSYNVTSMSFSPAELATEIKKHISDFEISYEPDFRQKIAESWPQSIDDSAAREEWGWSHDYDLAAMTKDMLEKLSEKLKVSY